MRSGGRLSGLILADAIVAGASMGGIPYAIQPAGVQVTSTVRQSVSGSGRFVGEFGYPDGPGWSNRQVKRMATKRRNQARNKKSHRG